ncbi:MAG: hypothetical protein HY788_11370 [Deltaproteobacteria bacterium]|nr:hypothetical protein [Deltaproteobacteria bacterium]
MQVLGTIYHHNRMVYHHGGTGTKYLILLNTPNKNEPYLFVKTTSQQKDRPLTPGCIKFKSLFFIQGGKTFFPKDTLVQLYELYEISPNDIDNNKDITVEASLDAKTMNDIINCLFEAQKDNISLFHKKLIRPPLQDSLLKLKEKFSKKR